MHSRECQTELTSWTWAKTQLVIVHALGKNDHARSGNGPCPPVSGDSIRRIHVMTIKLVWSVGGCSTKQQMSRENAASRHDRSQREDPILDPVDCLNVMIRKILMNSLYQLSEEVREGRLGKRASGAPDHEEQTASERLVRMNLWGSGLDGVSVLATKSGR
ncbi:hypothetical protein E2C01_061400 [Portunus trituberculatus]|uniref:Uncharacterized protein n=1 Tax=Portunus trituberculatus TaxID=210409 RepID=A0A5B7H539_PORTR|nr:hypothetical protein [Portunus trituberculatus]